MSRSHVMFLLKALVSVGVLAFLLSRIEISEFFKILAEARLSFLVLVLAFYLIGQLLGTLRWELLARPLGFDLPFKDYLIYYFIGMFFNLFTPSTVGGDLGRVYYLAQGASIREEKGWSGSTLYALVSVVTDRAIGMAVLVWLGAVAVAVFPQYGLPSAIRYTVYGLAFGLLVGGLLVPKVANFLQGVEYSWAKELRVAAESYQRNWPLLMKTMALSLVVHFIQAWLHLLTGRALGLTLPWSYCLILYPLVGTFSALPVSLNGLGLRESGYVFLLGIIGVNSEQAIAFGLLWFMVIAVDSLIGGVVFLLYRGSRAYALSRTS